MASNNKTNPYASGFYSAAKSGNSREMTIRCTEVQFRSLNLVARKLDMSMASRSEVIRRVLDEGLAFLLGEEFKDARREELLQGRGSVLAAQPTQGGAANSSDFEREMLSND